MRERSPLTPEPGYSQDELRKAYEFRAREALGEDTTPSGADTDQIWVEEGDNGEDKIVARRTKSEAQIESWRIELEETERKISEALAEPTEKTFKARISKFIEKILKRKKTEGIQGAKVDTEQGARLEDSEVLERIRAQSLDKSPYDG